MSVDENERWTMVCEPTLKRIESAVDKLTVAVVIGNGKPSLLARVDGLEKTAAEAVVNTGTRSRSLELGPLKINGYMASDLVKIVLVIMFGVSLWFMFTDRAERKELALRLEKRVQQQP